jgi:hypothetical protein
MRRGKGMWDVRIRRQRSLLTVPLAAAMLFLVAAGASIANPTPTASGGGDPDPSAETTLAHARDFRGFPVYFAGPKAAGYPLVAILRIDRTSPAPHTEFTFIYGRCESPRGQGCSPPLTIISWPACYRYETRYALKREERTIVRGVPARLFRDFARIELYPAATTIVVQGSVTRVALRRIALALRSVNVAIPAGATLPPRPPHVKVGTVKCRRR